MPFWVLGSCQLLQPGGRLKCSVMVKNIFMPPPPHVECAERFSLPTLKRVEHFHNLLQLFTYTKVLTCIFEVEDLKTFLHPSCESSKCLLPPPLLISLKYFMAPLFQLSHPLPAVIVDNSLIYLFIYFNIFSYMG